MVYNDDIHRYDYMLDMPYKKSTRRKHMSITDRAAQFGAFRALTGYEDAISETGRLTNDKIELDEYQKADIDAKLQYIANNIDSGISVSVVYFVPDKLKQGGEYVTHKGTVNKIREYEKRLVFSDKVEINIDLIVELEVIQIF